MSKSTLWLSLGVLAVALAGCETPYGTPDRTGTGALAGGGIGAASGAIIGAASGGHAGTGALIGGAVGAITGALIGHSMDMDEQARLRAQAPATYGRVEQGQPLNVADVKALAQAKLSDDVIITQIRNSRTVYHLSATDIIDLQNAGVSQGVINYMINTPNTVASAPPVNVPPGSVVVQGPPPAPPTETIVATPGPGYIWIAGEWVWEGQWVWVGGHWTLPPAPGAVWVHAYWARGPHGWFWARGHWRY
ncbi:MAG: hypothetical protein C5B50_30330 [Verrucomicrobia bacterium]|nr:MAG: hypothetical protein C5B50_30330 [Verrucomicrobiota bacterium]